jgi:hypothetical protein
VDGGLVYYRGREGEHQSMHSGRPITLVLSGRRLIFHNVN